MKILWIEDGGGSLRVSQVAAELFQGLLPIKVFDSDYDPDESPWLQLPGLFEKHSAHQLMACKSYLEWKKAYDEEDGDFDVVLLDINLEAYQTPAKQRPISNPDFDKKAGLFIYNQLVKSGFPEENIAFLTGEENSLREFIKGCQTAFMTEPKNTFEKKPSDFVKIRQWLAGKKDSAYLTLRRGIIEGCRFLTKELNGISDLDLRQQLLFYQATRLNINQDGDFYRRDMERYLATLQHFLPLRQPKNLNNELSLFVTALVGRWAESFSGFDDKQPLNTKSRLEDKFHRNAQGQLKLLRDWVWHDLLSPVLAEKEVAFFFLLAMRAWLYLEFAQVYKFERIMADLFNANALVPEELDENIVSHLEGLLNASYTELVHEVGYEDMPKSKNNYFLALCRSYGDKPRYLNGNLYVGVKRAIQKRSRALLYQAFWHGLFPSWPNPKKGDQSVSFDLESIPKGSFAHFLGGLIYADSFPKTL
ncbi:MAG: hypothetical protein GY862_04875 [Gammaproteobacteria bacterium]|nr:hypothetical protein [Gammaproteobacteria bacterium]